MLHVSNFGIGIKSALGKNEKYFVEKKYIFLLYNITNNVNIVDPRLIALFKLLLFFTFLF